MDGKGNQHPVIVLEKYWLRTNKGEPVEFNASRSYDPDGNISKVLWDFGDGQKAEGLVVQHAYARAGTFTANITVYDDETLFRKAGMTIVVNSKPPVSIPGYTINTTPGIPVELDGSASFDPDGQVVTYEWSFGDGTFAEGPVVSHVYNRPDAFEAALRVTDDDGVNHTSYTIVKVVQPPVATVVNKESSDALLIRAAALLGACIGLAAIGLIVAVLRRRK